MPFTITADSKPDFDDWGPDDYWSCADWITWHKAMKEKYGLEKANLNFIYYYQQAGFGAASYDCRTFNNAFRKYADENGFLEDLYGGIGVIMQPVGWAIETGGDIADNLGEGATTVSKILKVLIPVAAVALIAGVGYWGYKTYLKDKK